MENLKAWEKDYIIDILEEFLDNMKPSLKALGSYYEEQEKMNGVIYHLKEL